MRRRGTVNLSRTVQISTSWLDRKPLIVRRGKSSQKPKTGHSGSGTQSINGTGLSCPDRGLFTREGHWFDPRGTSRGSACLGSFPRLFRGPGQLSSLCDREACL
jgi:hypothetical protein